MMIPQIFSLSSSSSAGSMRAALLLSRNFITISPQFMLERISMMYGDLKPIARGSPSYWHIIFSYAAIEKPRSCAEISRLPFWRSNLMWFDALFAQTDTRRTVLRSCTLLILRTFELFCGITSLYLGYFPTTRRQITTV